MPTPIVRKDHFPTIANRANREKTGNQERLPSQTAEDWLFAYVNAPSYAVRETLLPHLVESVEELIAEFQQMHARQTWM